MWTSEPKALPELDISGMVAVSLENALQHSSIQGSDQADVDRQPERRNHRTADTARGSVTSQGLS
jgi:hypothetical protein